MTIFKNLAGKQFGKLKVIKFEKWITVKNQRHFRESVWFCKCSCGGFKKVKRKYLISGKTSSCGCIIKRKYKINEDYFKEINSKDKAYFFGFIITDGNIYKKSLTIKLNRIDKKILETFYKYLKTDKKLYFYEHKEKKYKNITIKKNKSVTAKISNNKITHDLIKKGIPEKKSYIVKFPSNKIIPNNLMSHFLRGVFDGDGDVGNSDRNTGVKITSASLVFLKGMQKTLKKLNISNTEIKKEIYKSKITDKLISTYRLRINSLFKKTDKFHTRNKKGFFIKNPEIKKRTQQKFFFKYLYKNSNPDLFLLRKKNRVKKLSLI